MKVYDVKHVGGDVYYRWLASFETLDDAVRFVGAYLSDDDDGLGLKKVRGKAEWKSKDSSERLYVISREIERKPKTKKQQKIESILERNAKIMANSGSKREIRKNMSKIRKIDPEAFPTIRTSDD